MILEMYIHSAPAVIFSLGEAATPKQQQEAAPSLHAAVQYGCHRDVAALIAGGTRVDSQDIDGKTALHLALRKGDAAMTALLLMSGADASLETPEGIAPRTIARLTGSGLLLTLIESALLQQTFREIYGVAAG